MRVMRNRFIIYFILYYKEQRIFKCRKKTLKSQGE